MKTFRELAERKILSMKYKNSKKKEIVIFYEVTGDKATFKVPTKENTKDIDPDMSDVISVSHSGFKGKFDPELEIFNYLKSIDY